MNLRTKPTELISMLCQYVESFWPLKDVHPSGEPVGIPQTVKDGRMLGDVPKRCMARKKLVGLTILMTKAWSL